MKSYNLTIATENELEWIKFRKVYKEKKLGKNLNESIMNLIKKVVR